MNHQDVFNISQYCANHGVKNAVISPGSRNALLMLSFSRQDKIKTHVIPDERVAAFFALGLSQATSNPVALICTSGTAALNYAPAVAEAFFSRTPLLVFTADRPPEWIDQYDGQTIYQENVYGKHIKNSFNLPVSTETHDTNTQFSNMLNQGLIVSTTKPKGPVHFNVPIREPFYPESEPQFTDISTEVPETAEQDDTDLTQILNKIQLEPHSSQKAIDHDAG